MVIVKYAGGDYEILARSRSYAHFLRISNDNLLQSCGDVGRGNRKESLVASVEEVYKTLGVTHTKVNCTVCTTTQKPIRKIKWWK